MSAAHPPAVPLFGLGSRIHQVCYVVPDVDTAIANWGSLFDLGPFDSFDFSAASEPTYTHRGEKATWDIRLALNHGTPQVELIQPVSGPSVYQEHVDRRGYGLHHIGVIVDDVDQAVATMQRQGFEQVTYGSTSIGAFAYFDTTELIGCFLEAIWLPPDSPFR
ncbi:VOC family protein [Rhodococcus koreensis]